MIENLKEVINNSIKEIYEKIGIHVEVLIQEMHKSLLKCREI